MKLIIQEGAIYRIGGDIFWIQDCQYENRASRRDAHLGILFVVYFMYFGDEE